MATEGTWLLCNCGRSDWYYASHFGTFWEKIKENAVTESPILRLQKGDTEDYRLKPIGYTCPDCLSDQARKHRESMNKYQASRNKEVINEH